MKCKRCDGTGLVDRQIYNGTEILICPACNGTGIQQSRSTARPVCPKCGEKTSPWYYGTLLYCGCRE